MSKVIKGIVVAAAIYVTGGIAIGMMLNAGAIGFATAVSMASAINALTLSTFLSGVASQLAGGGGYRPSATVEYTGTVEPRRIIYGEIVAAGMNVIPPVTSGTNNKYLHQVSALAGHECDAITDVWFNQDLISSASIGAVTGSSSDGAVSSGTYSGKAWIRRYLGTSTQAADFILDSALSIWTTAHQGRGVAYVAVQFSFDETAYKSGKPEVKAKVRGKKCYDPRLDSSPGANPTSATYKAWTANPALQLVDYIIDATVGMGEDPARIDWSGVVTAANICDENVTVPNGSGGSTTQKRYTSNVALYAASSYEDNISTLVGTMLGSCLYSAGKWRIKAGAWEVAQFQITDSNVIGNGLEVATAYPYRDRYNGIRGSFIDPNNNWQANEFPATSNASYVSTDGEAVFKDVQFAACTNVYEAQRGAILLTRKSRNGMLVNVSCDMSLFKVRPGETGIATITELGWTSQLVRCEGWKFNPNGYVDLVLREENSADWNDPILTDYTTPTVLANPTPVFFTPDAPSGLASVATNRGPNLTWTAPALMPAGAVYEVWEYTASTPFSSATKVWEGISNSAVIPKTDTTVRYYWVRVRMPDGTTGSVHPSSTGVSGYGDYIYAQDLAVGATTEVYTSTVAGPNNVYSYPTPTAYTVASISVPSLPIATEMVVTVSGEYSHKTVTSSWGFYAYVQDTTTLGTDQVTIHWNGTAQTTKWDGSFNIERRFSVSSGTAKTFYFIAYAPGVGTSGEIATTSRVNMKVEVIKR